MRPYNSPIKFRFRLSSCNSLGNCRIKIINTNAISCFRSRFWRALTARNGAHRKFFLWLFALSALCAFVFVSTYADSAAAPGQTATKFDDIGDALWRMLAWLQTALALLVAPALSAGTIARERERGLLEGLILAPLTPIQIVIEKWLAALAPLLWMFIVLMPFSVFAGLMRSSGGATSLGVWGFQLLLIGASAALGVACSAWARRAHLALRSAYGLITLWLLASGVAAFLSGINPPGWIMIPGYKAPFYLRAVALSNPISGAHDLIANDGDGAFWPSASATLLLITAFCLWSATRAVRKPLAQAPFIGDGKAANARKKRARASANSNVKATASGHFEVPIVGALRFANPVLGREVRSKFRLRQPPLGVIVAEIVLALLVAVSYAHLWWTAFTDPSARGIVFWGVTVTGFILTLMGCGIMGANGFSREHEGGTWESLRLSLLRPREIIRGKAVGIALTCLLFSIPVWPLLLPCVNWSALWQSYATANTVTISQLVAVVFVWLGTIEVATLWGLWWGRRARVTSAASGAVLGSGTLWFAGVPLLVLLLGVGDGYSRVLMWLNPFFALSQTSFASPFYNNFSALGLPFTAFSLCFGLAVAASLERAMKREFG